ncbi:MAG: biotin transporter BioY [Clostridia bacterium]|nr:biotin transporter BioY [Clostridia bacterium]
MRANNIRLLTECAIFVALMAVASQASIPTPFVPITLQCLAVSLCGYYLGIKRGTISLLVYLALGAVGVPVFSMLNGGIYAFLGPTGGFIIGFLPLCVLCAIVPDKWQGVLLGILGVLICHLLGVLQYSYVGNVDFLTSFFAVSLPYIIKDIILVVLAFFLSRAIKKRISRQH